VVRRKTTRRPRRAPPTVDQAARSLWRDLADERRRGLVQTLEVRENVLVVAYTQEPVVDMPTAWEGFRVRQERYRRPASELETKVKNTALGFLGIAEKDPERFLKLAEGAVDATRNLAQFAQANSGEVKKFLLNNVITGVAKAAKKRLERG
jgi:hypothetical protein